MVKDWTCMENMRRIGILVILLIFLMTGCGSENTEVEETKPGATA